MSSNRVLATELVNGAEPPRHLLGRRRDFVYLAGDEYEDIFPV